MLDIDLAVAGHLYSFVLKYYSVIRSHHGIISAQTKQTYPSAIKTRQILFLNVSFMSLTTGWDTIYNNDNYITLVLVYAHEHLYLHIMHLYCILTCISS